MRISKQGCSKQENNGPKWLMNWPDWLICTLHAGEYLDVMLEAGCKKEVVEDRCASDFAPFFWAAWHPCSHISPPFCDIDNMGVSW